MAITQDPGARRQRFSPLLWIASFAALAVMIAGINGTLAQVLASILNTTNTIQTAPTTAFGLIEYPVTGGPGGTAGAACATAPSGTIDALCATLNKYGTDGLPSTAILLPGETLTTTVRLAHTAAAGAPGAVSGTLALLAGFCDAPPAPLPGTAPTDPGVIAACGAVTTTVACTAPAALPVAPASVPVAGPVPLSTLAGPYAAGTVAPGEAVDCLFTTTLAAGADAAALGVLINQQLRWSFTPVAAVT